MPESGLCDKTDQPDLDQPPDFPIQQFLNAEAENKKRELAAQDAMINTSVLIQKLQNQLDEYHAQYEALEKDYRAQRAKDARKTFQQNIISGIIGGVIGSALGGLLVYYWPTVERLILSVPH